MTITVNITLFDHSTAGNAPKVYNSQRIEILHEPPTVSVGVDGFKSAGQHPSQILWHGGTAADLTGITNVKMVNSSSGEVVIDGQLTSHHNVPRDETDGVRFDVL